MLWEGFCSGRLFSGVSVSDVGVVFVNGMVGTGRSRGREETGVKRSS